jgi:protein-disulfide isomerase
VCGAATIDALRERYGDTLRVVFRHFPLSFHVNGIPAAVAAECAREQGAFWAYHDRLFEHQDQLGNAELLQHANALGLKPKPFAKCMEAASHREKVEADVQAGAALGLSGAPAYFVNGRPVLGALPVDAFADIIEEELR